MLETNPIAELKTTTDQARLRLGSLENLEDLENWRLEILGRQGLLTNLMKGIGNLPDELRKEFGQIANQERGDLENAYKNRLSELKNAPKNADLMLPCSFPFASAHTF